MADITTASPQVYDEGTLDLSARTVPYEVLQFPQHLPKFWIFSEQGPLGPTYIDFGTMSLTKVYGDRTFDVNSKYYTHQTPFVQAAASKANNCIIHRLSPTDATDVANAVVYIDVLPTQVPLYKKTITGSIEKDSSNMPVPVTDSNGNAITVSGYKVFYVTDYTVSPIGEYQRGLATPRLGTQVEGSVQSTQYPLFEVYAKDAGEGGLKLSFSMSATLKTDIVPFQDYLLSDAKFYPYIFGMRKMVDTTTGKINPILNSFGAQNAKFVLAPKGIDPASGAVVDLERIVSNQYLDLPANSATGLGGVYVYRTVLEDLAQKFYDAEKIISDSYRDPEINTSENNIYALNILSFTSSNASPYQAIKLIDTSESTRLTKNTNVFLKGSSDGVINEYVLDSLVAADIERYADELDEYQDQVAHPGAIIYDSGFSLSTKKIFPKFISLRKDTVVVLSSYSHDAASISLSDQYSVGIALKTMLELYPESSTFGTPVMRGVVMMGSGYIINSLYTKRVPTSHELFNMAAQYMGASNGKWKAGYIFDKAPRSVFKTLEKLDITWVPTSTRKKLWSAGMNFALNYATGRQYFPAIQTVYSDDTSVLNSFFVVVAISYLNKIAHAAHREFSGDISLSPLQLVKAVNNFVAKQANDKFDGKLVVVPNAKITEFDALRGYSWTLPIKVYANNMKTVMTTFIEAYRMSDLAN